MLNMNLINETVDIVVRYFEAEGIYESSKTIKARAINWYNNTEITEAEMLAAAVMTGDYRFGIAWDELVSTREFFFGTPRFEDIHYEDEAEYLMANNFSIGEIEAAQHDSIWW